ncbi:hypothetical protein STENM223S_09160 [Streptomyces tendae]
MLGLDRQLHLPPGVGDELQQPLQGEHGGGLAVLRAVLPVGLLDARPPAASRVFQEPKSSVARSDELERRDRAASVGRTVDATVVHTDEVSVGGEAYVALECVRAVLDRLAVRGQGVLGGVLGGPAVRDDSGQVLPCVGHRVMVPPLTGGRAAGGVIGTAVRSEPSSGAPYMSNALYKE